MTPVMQTEMGTHGNCFSACLASIFDIPITDVPNFFHIAGESDEAWWAAVRDWLRPRGFGILWLALNDPAHLNGFEGWFIVCGKSARGLDHATIWRDGKMVHDPYPGPGGCERPEGVDLLYPLDPAAMTLK